MATVLENRLEAPALAEFGTPSWSDYGNTIFNVGGAEAAAFAPAIVRWGAQSLPDSELTDTIADSAKYLQDALHAYSEGSFDQLSPAMKERLTADILTSDEFWQHPLSVMTAQTARTLPTMAATGLSMLFSGGGLGALATAAAVGGVQGMGQSIDAMQRDVDTRSDTELKQFNPVYSQLRADGISEATARKQIQQAMIGAKPMAIFALSAVTNAFGPETQVLRALGMKGLGKVAEGGIARRVGKEFAQGALAEGTEEAGQQAFQEQAAVDAGFQPAVSLGNIAQSGLSAAAIGGILGAPAGIRRGETRPVPPSHDTTTAGERAHPDNPPGGFRRPDATNFPLSSDIAGIDPFTGGPVSMPPRGGDTQGTPPIVPGATPSPVPGGTTRRRSSKKAGAVSAVPVGPATAANENAPTVTGTARIVMDDAQATALGADQAFKNAIAAQNARASQADQAFKNASLLPIVTPPSAGTMPASGPQTNVAPATPAEDMGAGTTQAKVGDLVNIEIGGAIANPTPVRVRTVTPDGFVLVEGSNTGVPIQQVSVVTPAPRSEPVDYGEQYGPPRLPPVTAEYEQTQDYPRQPRTADGRRVLDTVPDQATLGLIDTRNEQLAARNARLPETTVVDTTPAPVAGKALPKGKDAKRNAKTAADDVKAQTLLDERPREMVASSVPEFRKALQNIIGKASKLGIGARSKVGYDTTPDTLVWLAEAKALFKKLNLKGISTQDKTDAINTFLDGEQQLIRDGNADIFRSERAQEGAAQKQGVYTADENEADTSVGPAAPAKAVGVRGTNRPALGIESYSEEHNLPQKEGGEERDTRQQAVQRDVSKLSPDERAALIAEKRKPLTAKTAAALDGKKLKAEARRRKKLAAENEAQARKVEAAKKEAKVLAKAGAESDEQVRIRLAAEAAARKASEAEEAARKEAEEAAKKPEPKKKKLTQNEKALKVRETARVRTEKKAAAAAKKQAEAETKAEEKAVAAKKTTPKTQKALEAIQTAERVKARKQAEKQARSEAAAAKRTPFGVLKAQTRKAQEAKARAFKPVVRTKLEIARSLAAKRAKRPTLTLPTKLRSLQALSSPQVKERLFGKKKLQAEKKKVEEAHSPAKHEADNFAKGHVSIEGVPISLETKAGFGSIPGTVDTNGKPVKVLLGEEAVPGNKSVRDLQVAVIDQVDPSTGALTNHVVLYGFDDIQAAVNEFDGNFPDQMGDFAVMSHDELQRWLKSKENAESVGVIVGTSESMRDEYKDAVGETEEARAINKLRAEAKRIANLARTHAFASGQLDRFLTQSQADVALHDIGPGKALFPEFAGRVKRLAGDVMIYFVPDEIYYDKVNGIGRDARSMGMYNPHNDIIIVPRRTVTGSRVEAARTILHEGTHAAIQKATYENPKLVRDLFRIFDEAKKTWSAIDPVWSHYGLTNVNEMLAEAFSNPAFQEFLVKTKASARLKADLGLSEKIQSMWDALVYIVADAFGYSRAYGHKSHESLMSAIMKVSERLEPIAEDIGRGPMTDQQLATLLVNWEQRRANNTRDITPTGSSNRLLSRVTDRIPERFRPAPGQEQMSNPRLLFLRSMDGIAQLSKMFGRPFYEHVRAIASTLERIRVSANRYLQEWLPIIEDSRKLERKYKGTEHWSNYQNLMHDERAAGVFAHLPLEDQPSRIKDPLNGAYARARLPDLNTRWRALPDDLKTARMQTLNFYAARQNQINEKKLRNVMRAAGFNDTALMHRIFNRTETEADKAFLGPVYDHIVDVEELSKVDGPYYPFTRRGDHVVRALYKITAPRRFLREIPNEDGSVNTWEFGGPSLTTEDAQKMATDYAATQTDLYPTVTSLWVNEATGERTYIDASGEEQRVKAEDPDSVKRFRVSVENRYVEFFNETEARRVALEMESHLGVIPGSVKGVEERRFQPQDRQMDLASYKMQALANTIKKRKSFQNLSAAEQAEVEGVLMEAGLRMLPHTRIQTRHLPFNHIQGASRDSTRAMLEHAESMSGFMSRLDHQQDLNEAVAGIMKETGSDAGKSLSRSHIANHVLQRIQSSNASPATGFWNGMTSRWLITSYLARLVSPATNMINMLQPITTTLPMLAARHGPGRAAREMLRVYKQIGTGHTLKTGLIATGRAIRHGVSAEHPSMIEDMMVGMTAGQKRMVKELIDLGSIDPDAGIEVSLLHDVEDSVKGRVDRGLDYLQRFSRQMPRAIEAINRVVTAVAAYNLEMEKTGNHDTAVRFAQETTNMTQGIYSRTNAAPIFNHPLGRISFQFKQYAQLIYGLIGHQIEKAYRAAEPGDRAEALKTLGYMTLAYGTVAGTMGLPTEPIKLLLMAAAPLGLPFKWEDFEHGERELMAGIFGQQIGEIITHGISRALPEGLSFDLSSRVGLQDLLLFGEPRSQDEQDVKAYLLDVVAGAPGALVKDWFQGTQDLLGGDVLSAAQKLNPVKVGADLVKSYRMATEGKKTGAGYQSLSPYSLGEAAIRTFGFTPARESEAGEASRYFYAKQAEAQGARGSYMHQWAVASGSERGRLWGQIERYNSSREDDEKLTRADLDRYVRSRATIEKSRRSGLRLTRREKSLYKDITGVYNIQ